MDRALSTIELTFLGMTWLRGPCTIYAVMKELSASESTFHRSRAGTAYSVAKRLKEEGLIEELEEPGERGEKLLHVTSQGLRQLQNWIQSPVPLMDIAHTADLVRLRFFFLAAVPVEQRLGLIRSALDGLFEFHERCIGLLSENEQIGDYFGVLATSSIILETRARIKWLILMRDLVGGPPEGKGWAETALRMLDEADPPRWLGETTKEG
jgi:PadR family transcriptional regulator, regulatory protein AphA